MPSSPILADMWAAATTAGDRINRLVTAPVAPHTARLLRMALYAWLALQTLFALPAASAVWGTEGYALPPASSGLVVDAASTVLNHPAVTPFWPAFVAGQLAALALGLLNRHPRLAAVLVWFFTRNLDSRCLPLLNGGYNLVEILLTYNLLLDPNARGDGRGSWAVTASNVGLALCRFQVAVMYTVSGLSKLQGTLWPHGVAMYYVLNTPEFTHPWAAPLAKSDLFVCLASYGTLAFMLSFPTLVWVRRARPFVLGVGFALHAGIATVMGLVDFATAVMVSYVAFFPDAWSQRVIDTLWGGPLAVPRPSSGWETVIRFLDWRRVVRFTDDGQEPRGIRWVELVQVLGRLPLTAPLVPFAWAIGYTGLGQMLVLPRRARQLAT